MPCKIDKQMEFDTQCNCAIKFSKKLIGVRFLNKIVIVDRSIVDFDADGYPFIKRDVTEIVIHKIL